MDKASDFGSEDCRFESCHGRQQLFFSPIYFHKNVNQVISVINNSNNYLVMAIYRAVISSCKLFFKMTP
jgi:hypothetical protein